MKKISTLAVIILLLSASLFAESKTYLGVFLRDLTESDFEKVQLDSQYGVMVIKVTEESPADKAGIQAKDIILTIAGEKVYTRDQVKKMIQLFNPEQNVKFVVNRQGKSLDLITKLGEKKTPEIIKKAYMGVFLSNLNDTKAKELKYDKGYGVLLENVVEEGPSAKAGLESNDIIMEINNEKIYTQDQLTKMLENYKPEQSLNVLVYRNKKISNYTVILGEKDIFDHNLKSLENIFVYKLTEPQKYIGVLLKDINEQLRKTFGVKHGVMIEEVNPETPAEKAGLQAGDIITEIDKEIINNIKDVHKSIQSKEFDQRIAVKINRDKKEKTINVNVGKRESDLSKWEDFGIMFDKGNLKIIQEGVEAQLLDLNDTIRTMSTITIERDSIKTKENILDDEEFMFDFDIEFFEDSGEI